MNQSTSVPDPSVLQMLNSIYPVSRETIARLKIYEELLNQWQKKTNLVAPSTLSQFWTRHVADSLQLVALAPDCANWTDIGSGGGFPGMVLAIVMADRKSDVQSSVQLVESIHKKCAFLRRVAHQCGVKAEVHCMRIESATEQLQKADIVTARALASLGKLLELTEGNITGNRKALFHKGKDYLAEIEECRGKWRFDLVTHPGRIDADSVILEIANAARL